MEAALRVAKLIALGLLAFIGYKLLILTMQPHEAVVSTIAVMRGSVPFSLDMALHYSEWTVLICLALLSFVFILRASIFDPIVRIITLVLLAFIAYRLLVLTMLPCEAIVGVVMQLSKSVTFSLQMARQYSEWTVLICLALVSLVCMLRAVIFEPVVK
jgi:hypothetical protein